MPKSLHRSAVRTFSVFHSLTRFAISACVLAACTGARAQIARVTSSDGPGRVHTPLSTVFPSVTSVAPASGPAGGGNFVVLNGVNFTQTSTVSFGSTPAATVQVQSATQIYTYPQPGSGTVNVYVTNSSGTSTAGTGNVYKFVPPSVAVGSSVQSAVLLTFTASGTTAATTATAIQVLTQGAPGLDFTYRTGGTCAVNVTYSAGATCSVNFTFTSAVPGQRLGAVNLLNSSGTVIATSYIGGTGTGSLATFSPGAISTVAGNGAATFAGDGGAATAASLTNPYNTAFDGAGNLYIADTNNNRIRKVAVATGFISTVAGGGTSPESCTGSTNSFGDGCAATAASLNSPQTVAVDGAGNLYIAEYNNQRIRKVTASTGTISTVAGNGTAGYTASQDTGTTAATAASLNYPAGVAVDAAGNLYIADTNNSRIRMVTAATGTISTVAGNGTAGYTASQDTGTTAATAASINFPAGVAVDGVGNLYVADSKNNRIREVTAANGFISTVAGNGTAGYTASQDMGTTAATATSLNFPQTVAVDAAGNLYIGDLSNNRVRKVTAATAFISTVAGNGTAGYTASQDTGTTASTATSLNLPFGVTLDGAGNLYIADYSNHRIRKVTASAALLAFPNTAINGTSANQTVTVNNTGNADLTLTIPSTGQNPSVPNYFTRSNSSTCPQLSTSSSAGTLAAGATCTEILSFTPTMAGAVTSNLIFTDNSLNATGATQAITMTGTTATVLTVAAVGQNIPSGTASITLEFTVGYGGNTAPTGTPTLTVNGSATGVGTIACTGKAGHRNCTATYDTSTLAAGTYTIAAAQPGDSTYTAASATAILTVTGTSGSHIATPVRTSSPITSARTAVSTPAVAPRLAAQPVPAFAPLLTLPVFSTTSIMDTDSSADSAAKRSDDEATPKQ